MEIDGGEDEGADERDGVDDEGEALTGMTTPPVQALENLGGAVVVNQFSPSLALLPFVFETGGGMFPYIGLGVYRFCGLGMEGRA